MTFLVQPLEAGAHLVHPGGRHAGAGEQRLEVDPRAVAVARPARRSARPRRAAAAPPAERGRRSSGTPRAAPTAAAIRS